MGDDEPCRARRTAEHPVTELTFGLAAEIAAADLRVEAAQRDRNDVVAALQASCPHHLVAEAPIYRSDYGPSLPAFRVCERCGATAEGRGICDDFSTLRDDPAARRVYPITRDVGYPMRRSLP